MNRELYRLNETLKKIEYAKRRYEDFCRLIREIAQEAAMKMPTEQDELVEDWLLDGRRMIHIFLDGFCRIRKDQLRGK